MNYGNIKNFDIANGRGVRVSLFVSGCTHHCAGCFNPETWDFNYGEPYTQEIEDKVIEMLGHGSINGLSLIGGEPMEPQNQKALLPLVKRAKKLFPEKDIWCYTGYTLENLMKEGFRANAEETKQLLSLIDVLVDGPFMIARKNISLQFRGSENQRIIDMNTFRKTGEIVSPSLF